MKKVLTILCFVLLICGTAAAEERLSFSLSPYAVFDFGEALETESEDFTSAIKGQLDYEWINDKTNLFIGCEADWGRYKFESLDDSMIETTLAARAGFLLGVHSKLGLKTALKYGIIFHIIGSDSTIYSVAGLELGLNFKFNDNVALFVQAEACASLFKEADEVEMSKRMFPAVGISICH